MFFKASMPEWSLILDSIKSISILSGSFLYQDQFGGEKLPLDEDAGNGYNR